MAEHHYDVFISHASEDKETFVRPLAVALNALGVTVWYDEFSLRIGDSLSRSIDQGIARSRHGLVVVSGAFIQKPWPEYELRGLVTREITGVGSVLPIWHGVSHDEVASFSPPLADKVAIRTGEATAEDIAVQVLAVVRPDIYEAHPRHELQKLVSGEAVRELQAELDSVREDLANFQCPYCGSFQVDHGVHGIDEYEVEITNYECGLCLRDGRPVHMCPHDPNFPKLEDYDLECSEHAGYWQCTARPKTKYAKHHRIGSVKGRSKAEAIKAIGELYRRSAGHKPDESIMILY
ncbi:TIR domain-containing protein [Sinorhizobium meliloti]|uniref:TIR domain-containing protein n=1 Tax=Rhizobium meliloti TaxID=382 RepID=UPI003D65BA8D